MHIGESFMTAATWSFSSGIYLSNSVLWSTTITWRICDLALMAASNPSPL